MINEESLLKEQIERLVPLIDEERRVFIKKEYGRLQALIGTDYWDEGMGESRYFHQYIEEGKEMDAQVDPYEITLEELRMLSGVEKRVERIGTYSYLPFFQMLPCDKERILFLAESYGKLKKGEPCTLMDVEKLEKGHKKYIEWKLKDPVEVKK